jgi:hypothetical protein
MKAINPDVIHYLIQQDRAAVERLVLALQNEAKELADRVKVSAPDVYHLQSAQSTLTDLHYRLTRLRAFSEILPKP